MKEGLKVNTGNIKSKTRMEPTITLAILSQQHRGDLVA
jgi:hypothetical protein